MTYTFLHRFLQLCGFDEYRCAACHIPFRTGRPSLLCEACAGSIVLSHTLCPLCGVELSREAAYGASSLCGNCLVSPPPWERLHLVGLYKGAIRDIMLRVKFEGDRGLAKGVGTLLAERIFSGLDTLPDALVPMPLHPKRLRERGFNQCYELARPVSSMLGIPIKPFWAWRTKEAQPQTGLSRKERLKNLNNVFAAAPDVQGKHVLILDDTMTTGTSLRRLAECLLDAGAAHVEAAAVAVVPSGRHTVDA